MCRQRFILPYMSYSFVVNILRRTNKFYYKIRNSNQSYNLLSCKNISIYQINQFKNNHKSITAYYIVLQVWAYMRDIILLFDLSNTIHLNFKSNINHHSGLFSLLFLKLLSNNEHAWVSLCARTKHSLGIWLAVNYLDLDLDQVPSPWGTITLISIVVYKFSLSPEIQDCSS